MRGHRHDRVYDLFPATTSTKGVCLPVPSPFTSPPPPPTPSASAHYTRPRRSVLSRYGTISPLRTRQSATRSKMHPLRCRLCVAVLHATGFVTFVEWRAPGFSGNDCTKCGPCQVQPCIGICNACRSYHASTVYIPMHAAPMHALLQPPHHKFHIHSPLIRILYCAHAGLRSPPRHQAAQLAGFHRRVCKYSFSKMRARFLRASARADPPSNSRARGLEAFFLLGGGEGSQGWGGGGGRGVIHSLKL